MERNTPAVSALGRILAEIKSRQPSRRSTTSQELLSRTLDHLENIVLSEMQIERLANERLELLDIDPRLSVIV